MDVAENRFVAIAMEETVIIYDMWSKNRGQRFPITQEKYGSNAHTKTVWSLQFFKFEGGQYLVSGGMDRCVRVWKLIIEDTSQHITLKGVEFVQLLKEANS